MEFSYEIYRDTTLVWPIMFIVPAMFFLLIGSYMFWFKQSAKRTKQSVLSYIFGVLMCIWITIPSATSLLNGGIYIGTESEDDAISYTGTIEEICTPSTRFPDFKTSHNYGADIVIDGETYFVVSCGEFEEGDSVTIHYLPDSHFILCIYEVPVN